MFWVLRSTINTLSASPLKFGHFYCELHNKKNWGNYMAWINAALNLLCLNSVSFDFSFSVEEGQDLRTPVQQTNEQTLTTSKHTFKNGDTDFLCHLKFNRGKSRWINRRWNWIILSLTSLIVFKENIVMIVMLQRLLGSPLNYLYLYANKTVWVKPLSLICITSFFYTIYSAKFFSVYGREDLAVNTVLNHSGSFFEAFV